MKKFRRTLAVLLIIQQYAMLSAATTPDNVVLSGKVTDSETKETIPGAGIYIPDLKTGTISGIDGSYTIPNLPARKIIIQVSLIGYKTILETIDLSASNKKDFVLTIAAKEINEIIITGSSQAIEKNRTATPVTVVPKTELLENSNGNIIDAISKQPGISQISTGNGISKPVIRGLGYNRVVVVNDGIRQEGQQWGDEHGIEIDDNSVDKVEILKGPASLSYGSDAIAGVINMLTAPTLPEGVIAANTLISYQSNSGLFGYSINAAGNKKGWIFDIRYSNKISHDYKNKYDGYVYNSRFSENSLSALTGLNRSWGFLHFSFSAFEMLPGIVEGERDSSTGKFIKPTVAGDSVIFSVVPQKDFLKYDETIPYQNITHYKGVINSSIIIKNGTLKTIFGFQQNNRKEYSDVVSGNYGLYLQLNTFNYEMKYLFPEMNNYNLEIGVNGMYQVSMNNGTEFLVPAYHLFDAGVFGIIRKNIKSIDITAGLRYDRRNQDASALFLDEDGKSVNGNIPGSLQKFKKFDRTFEGFSGSAGLSWQISELVYSKLNFAAGYRSPNIAELGANGIHEGTFRFEKGNSNLAPEKSIQGDLGIGMNTSHVTAELDLFDNRIRNYIYLAAMQSISGGDSTEDGATVFNYVSGDAELHGGEFLIDIHPHPLDWLHFENSISFVRAIQNNRPDSMKYLPNTPATRLNTEIRIGGKKILQVFSNPYFRLGITTWLRQDNIFSAYGTETSTPGYTLMNAGIGADLFLKKKEHFTINFSVNNIADVAYQNHLSRLKYAPENPVTGKTGVFNEGRSFNMKFGFYF